MVGSDSATDEVEGLKTTYTRFEDVVVALDSSISMRAHDYEPSRFEAAKSALMRFVDVRLTTSPMDRVGVVVFYGYALPVTRPMSSRELVVSLVSKLKVLGEATNLGDALIMAANMFDDTSMEGFTKRILVITDGTFNQGPDPETAALYAVSRGIRVDFVTLGKLEGNDLEVIEGCTSETGGIHLNAENTQKLLTHITNLADRRRQSTD
ncbi:MAG: VWA domain-containing protein [Thermoprotei archaeon]